MKERGETTEGEERNDFSWREGNKKKKRKSLPRLLSAEQRAGNRERERRRSGREKGEEKRGERTKTKALKGRGEGGGAEEGGGGDER